MPISKNRRKNTKKSVPATKEALPKQAESVVALPEHRSMEQVMAGLQQGFTAPKLFGGDSYERDPLFQAQDLMYDAWECGTKRDRIKLAKQALEISEQCADAYVMLAQEAAKNVIEARGFYELAVAAGEKAIGPEAFEQDVGHFWGILETRPYMRARSGLAQCLWDLGERKEAARHLLDQLRLNPNDNQGLRYILMSWLLTLGDDLGLEKILDEYNEDSAWSTYSRALLLFKRKGPTEKAGKALKEAVKNNTHVADFLLRAKPLPRTLPEYYSPGSKEEAVFYLGDNRENWATTEGALKWLACAFR